MAQPERCPRGDADCDGLVESLDAAFVLQYVARLIPSLLCHDTADADGNGAISALDAAIILQFVAGLIPGL
jgi:hypothetical protein